MPRERQQPVAQAASAQQAPAQPARTYDPGLQATIDGYYAASQPAAVYDDEIPF